MLFNTCTSCQLLGVIKTLTYTSVKKILMPKNQLSRFYIFPYSDLEKKQIDININYTWLPFKTILSKVYWTAWLEV